MSVLRRLSGIVRAKANKALDRAEDPRDTLDQSYERQLEQLQQVRRGLASVATARRRLELQAAQLQASATTLHEQAGQALAQHREDLAREALSRRAGIGAQLEELGRQHAQLAAQEEQLTATTRRLEEQVGAFRTKKESLKASYSAAQAQARVGEEVAGISASLSGSGLALQRAEERVEEMQARAGAVSELLETGTFGGGGDPLQAELDRAAAPSQVELDLARLKGQLAPAGGASPARLPAAEVTRTGEAAERRTASPAARADPFRLPEPSQ